MHTYDVCYYVKVYRKSRLHWVKKINTKKLNKKKNYIFIHKTIIGYTFDVYSLNSDWFKTFVYWSAQLNTITINNFVFKSSEQQTR